MYMRRADQTRICANINIHTIDIDNEITGDA